VNCVILQPSYLPWRGYFHQVHKADVFVFLDDVQYDARGWRNRNRILGPAGPQWITVPVHSQGSQTRQRSICSIEICWDSDWPARHLRTLQHCYRRAPFYDDVLAWLQPHYLRRPRFLAELTIDLTIDVARRLRIEHTGFLRSSDLHVEGRKTERLLSILRHVRATHYITGPSARTYLDESLLLSEGITVEYMSYDYPTYPQLQPGFAPQVSIVDLMFMTGPDAGRFIWGRAGPITSP
jgi:hypothetical protein